VTFVATRRNGRALCFGGFYYHINKTVDERSYWKCRTKGCKSTVVTINDVISSASGQHLHDPNDSRVNDFNSSDNNLKNGLQSDHNKQLMTKTNANVCLNKKQRNFNQFSNHSFSNKKFKSNNSMKSTNNTINNNNNNNSLSLITEHLNEELMDSFVEHLNVEIEVDECGKVKIEENEDSYNESNNDLIGESSDSKPLQLMPNIKPNSVYFTNNCYTNIEHFDIEITNLFKVIRQSGFKSLDIDQLSTDWELWKKRYLELKKAKNKSKILANNGKDVENLKLQLEIAINAKNNAERELKRVQRNLKESQNNVSALRIVLRKNLNNGSNNQCIALLNEINELKRKVCAQVDTYQSNLNEVKRFLCLDDNELRTEFDQLAQERDHALRDNLQLKHELSLLRNQLSLNDKSD
jgi:hypothetical protein